MQALIGTCAEIGTGQDRTGQDRAGQDRTDWERSIQGVEGGVACRASAGEKSVSNSSIRSVE